MIAPSKARRVRPNMPHYGVMPDNVDAMLTWDWVERQMTVARSYWICTTREDGRPHCVPIWGAWVEGILYLGTDKLAVKARNIRRDSRVVIHLESGDETVIFEGELAEAQLSQSIKKKIDDCYFKKYDLSPELEVSDALMFRLAPHKVMAWLESDLSLHGYLIGSLTSEV